MKNIILITLLSTFFYLYANERVTLQLSWKNQFQFAGYYMAKELGYYKDAGIDLDIKEYSNGINVVDSVIRGKNDFAVGRSSIIINKSNGSEITALAAIYQQSPLVLLVKKDSGIENITDLKDKKIMMTTDARRRLLLLLC